MHFNSLLAVVLVSLAQVFSSTMETMGRSSIQHSNVRQRGVIVTSIDFKEEVKDVLLSPPLWVTNYLHPVVSDMSPPESEHSPLGLKCYFEMVGFLDCPRFARIDNIIGAARLKQLKDNVTYASVECEYRYTYKSKSLAAISIPVVYYCPVHSSSVCEDRCVVSADSEGCDNCWS
jgi:hypothetical protein